MFTNHIYSINIYEPDLTLNNLQGFYDIKHKQPTTNQKSNPGWDCLAFVTTVFVDISLHFSTW